MITPPFKNPIFYSLLLEKSAAQYVIGLVAESFAKNDDIEQVMVTSQDFTSDVEATVELQTGAQEIASNLVDVDEEFDCTAKYNPMYLPFNENIYDVVEVDDEGDVVEVAGFKNPFITMTLQYSLENQPNVIDAKVLYKQFNLPALHTALENKELVS